MANGEITMTLESAQSESAIVLMSKNPTSKDAAGVYWVLSYFTNIPITMSPEAAEYSITTTLQAMGMGEKIMDIDFYFRNGGHPVYCFRITVKQGDFQGMFPMTEKEMVSK